MQQSFELSKELTLSSLWELFNSLERGPWIHFREECYQWILVFIKENLENLLKRRIAEPFKRGLWHLRGKNLNSVNSGYRRIPIPRIEEFEFLGLQNNSYPFSFWKKEYRLVEQETISKDRGLRKGCVTNMSKNNWIRSTHFGIEGMFFMLVLAFQQIQGVPQKSVPWNKK